MSRLPTLGPRGEGWVAIQGVLLLAIGLAGVAMQLEPWPFIPEFDVVGVVLLLAGGILAVRGIVDLRGALTPLPHPRDGAELVQTGSYRLVRHPIYGGLVVGAAGFGIVSHSLVAIAGSLVLLVFFTLKSGREEAWLRDRYPGYAAYATRTKRMIPFLY